jgi:hypothetical protein
MNRARHIVPLTLALIVAPAAAEDAQRTGPHLDVPSIFGASDDSGSSAVWVTCEPSKTSKVGPAQTTSCTTTTVTFQRPTAADTAKGLAEIDTIEREIKTHPGQLKQWCKDLKNPQLASDDAAREVKKRIATACNQGNASEALAAMRQQLNDYEAQKCSVQVRSETQTFAQLDANSWQSIQTFDKCKETAVVTMVRERSSLWTRKEARTVGAPGTGDPTCTDSVVEYRRQNNHLRASTCRYMSFGL